jgi:lysophospholipase L1-like esterase
MELNIQEFADKGIVSLGNIHRIAKVMKKAAAGEDITIGIIGGSITRGSLATAPELCYAYLVYQWWVEKFGDSNISYVNAGVGGTTSQFGIARVDSDLLDFDPDFVITEFSVNDRDEVLFKETYEGLVRKILMHKTEPAIMILNNVRYNNGLNAQRIHNAVGIEYDLAMINIKESLYAEIEAGHIPSADITTDFLHPNDLGHKIVAEIVINALEKIYDEVFRGTIPNIYKIPKHTITQNRYMNSVRYNNKNAETISKGFTADLTKQDSIQDKFRNGWKAAKVGDTIHFEFTGGIVSVQYCKTIRNDAPIAKAVIDGEEENAILIDANLSNTRGDSLAILNLLVEDESKIHTLDITIVKVSEESEIDFYLASILVAN